MTTQSETFVWSKHLLYFRTSKTHNIITCFCLRVLTTTLALYSHKHHLGWVCPIGLPRRHSPPPSNIATHTLSPQKAGSPQKVGAIDGGCVRDGETGRWRPLFFDLSRCF
jgi:hypothetical protein